MIIELNHNRQVGEKPNIVDKHVKYCKFTISSEGKLVGKQTTNICDDVTQIILEFADAE